jgi:hypothetical protein
MIFMTEITFGGNFFIGGKSASSILFRQSRKIVRIALHIVPPFNYLRSHTVPGIILAAWSKPLPPQTLG